MSPPEGSSPAWYQRPLDRTEALGALALVLYVVTGLPMPYWGTALVWSAMAVALAFIVHLSPWTFHFNWSAKIPIMLACAAFLFLLGHKGVEDEYRQANPAPAAAPTPLVASLDPAEQRK